MKKKIALPREQRGLSPTQCSSFSFFISLVLGVIELFCARSPTVCSLTSLTLGSCITGCVLYTSEQVNHLSHFLLTLELLPVLESTGRETGDVRVVFVSSAVHSWTSWDPDSLTGVTDYGRLKAYPKSKLYNVSAPCQPSCQEVSVFLPTGNGSSCISEKIARLWNHLLLSTPWTCELLSLIHSY